MMAPTRFRFLNDEHDLITGKDWVSSVLPKLWTYNLHYFDDLNATGAAERGDWHRALIARWVAENPPGTGTGWEPYPLSLRIVNWIKWALSGNSLGDARESLAVQVRFLTGRLERHLLGNHLFANAKALVFAGCFFEGDEASEWLHSGMAILEREIPEQILADGGHFERSTMYHALAYEDMLDLANLSATFPEAFTPWASLMSAWPSLIGKMGSWLGVMCHPDGEIAFFNDAAIGIAPSPSELFAYAHRLGHTASSWDGDFVWLEHSGYIRVQTGDAVLLIDAAPVGPDYLPGHAHADTLSYELSLFGQRVVVNSGTSRYGLGQQREQERATAAHSTLEIDDQNSSEVWAGFRVAQRAYPFDVSVRREDGAIVVEAAHDGYRRLPGRAVHRRRWVLHERSLEVIDRVDGGFSKAISRMHFHPDIKLSKIGAGGTARWAGKLVRWETDTADNSLDPSMWHPEFGLSVPASCLSMVLPHTKTPATCRFVLDWK